MRILADENVPYPVVEALRFRGHDVVWMGEVSPGSTDEEVLAWAVREERLLLSLDKDFGELAFARRLPAACGVVLLRLSAANPEDLARKVLSALGSRSDWQGHFSVIMQNRIRMRPLGP